MRGLEKYILLTAFCLSSTLVWAQKTDPETEKYREESKELSTLYRGRLPSSYLYRFNGTYFAYKKAFSTGDIFYNGKEYHNVILNLDANNQELLVRPSQTAATCILTRDQVAWFTMYGSYYVNLQYMGINNAPEGYLELIKDGKTPLFRLRRKVFRTDTNPRNNPDMDGNFDPTIVNSYEAKETYYLLENGNLRSLKPRAARKHLREAADKSTSWLKGHLNEWHPSNSIATGALPGLSGPGKGIGLPDGFFEDHKEDTTTVQYADYALTATYRNKIYNIGTEGKAKGGRATISGTVFEAESGQPLPGVVIFDDNTSTYARTNSKGRYSINLPIGDNHLNFNAESKEDLTLKISLMSDGDFDVVMTESITLLKGAIISAESMREHRSTIMGVESVSINTMNKIPSAFGEGDVIKAVLTLPGVKSVGEASGGFNVRGGSADQNLILFNDNTIYNPSHLFGMFSAFNPDLIESVELYKSSIPAEYGGRISSVLSVKSKEGSQNKLKGSLGIGVLTSRGQIEGPLNGGKTTFIAGGRIAYSDWILNMLPKNSAYAGGGAGFGDANIGITHNLDHNNSLQLFGYFATDRFNFSGDTTFRYTNYNAALTWRHKGDDDSSMKLSVGYDHYTNTIGAHNWGGGAYDLKTNIRQAFVKFNRKKPLEQHNLSYGADVVTYFLDPGILTPYGPASQVSARRLDREPGLEPAIYLSDNWTITESLSLDGGLRLSAFLAQNPAKFYAGPEVRLSAKYSPARNLSFKAGFNTLQQYIHLISNTASISPMDTWRLSSADIAPTKGWQAAAGGYWTLLGAGLDFSLEAYYKESRNGLDYKSGAVLAMNPSLADDLVPVYGKAYGMEAMVKKPAGKLTGWLSYSYSRSRLKEMLDRGAETINGGNWYNAPYDKPHEFKLVANYALTHRYSLSMNVDYSTGRPVTIPIGRYYYGGAYRLAYSERNTYRIPDYFRVDAALNIDPGHYLKALAHASITIGVYNVTGRKNPYSVFFRTSSQGITNGYILSVFATQIPYINLNILF